MIELLLSLSVIVAAIGLGGGLYEVSVVDPVWPRRIDLVQPRSGGISRRRFWIPAHVVFEALLLASLVAAWSRPEIRVWLLVALASHVAMRIWSAVDFIPKALAFERAEAGTATALAARRWTLRSRFRLLLDLTTCGAAAMALSLAV